MFERYTEKARRCIFFARYEASQLGSPYIRTEHLLLGILRESRGLQKVLRVDMVELRKGLQREVIGAKVSTSVDLPLDDDCKRALAHAAKEAEEMKDKHIGTEHLLLGIMREERGRAAQVLREMGAPSVDEVRKSIVESTLRQEQELSKIPKAHEVVLIDEQSDRELSRFRGLPRIGDAIALAADGTEEHYRVIDVLWRCQQESGSSEVTQTRIEVRIRKEAAREG